MPSVGTLRGIRLSMTLTTPPTADDPNSKAAGPRSTSIRSASNGSTITAWSTLVLLTSIEPIPSVSNRMRSPWNPRRIGRLALGPNEVADTPGSLASVSPMVGFKFWVSSAPDSTDVPCNTSRSLVRTAAVTTTSPCAGSSWSWSRSASWCRAGRFAGWAASGMARAIASKLAPKV